MKLFRFLGVMSPAHILLFTWIKGKKPVGRDVFGNTYYRTKPRKGQHQERRWAMFSGAPEASNVPPEWHGWLHHQTDVVPQEDADSFRRLWQKPHRTNMTGTHQAYHPLKGKTRPETTGDYTPWTPPA